METKLIEISILWTTEKIFEGFSSVESALSSEEMCGCDFYGRY